MKIKYLLILTALVGLFFTACGGGEEESSGPEATTIEVTQNDNYFGSTPDNADNPRSGT